MGNQVTVTTTARGRFAIQGENDPPDMFVPKTFEVRIKGKIISPPGLTAIGTFEINSPAGNVRNEPKNFTARTGELIDLGVFNASEELNVYTLMGETQPPKPNTEITVEIDAKKL